MKFLEIIAYTLLSFMFIYLASLLIAHVVLQLIMYTS